ncbi:MAG: hypothetical protein ACI841_001926, partial [Planctomycetota bacterium]
ALASCGWPAAMAWMEERWIEERNLAALDGLLEGAARGRVAPSLASEVSLRSVLLFADERAVAGGNREFVERVARALSAVPPTGADGADLTSVVLEGWQRATPLGRWMRLVIIEGQSRQSTSVIEVIRNQLGASESSALQFAALRALAQLGRVEPPVMIAEPDALLRWALMRNQLDELTRLLVRTEVHAQGMGWLESISPGAEIGRTLSVWGIASRQSEISATGLKIALDAMPVRATVDHPLHREFRRLASFGHLSELSAQLDLLRHGADLPIGERARTLMLRSGLIADAEAQLILSALLDPTSEELRADAGAPELVDLALCCATPGVGWKARTALVSLLGDRFLQGDYLSACELAIDHMRRSRLDGEIANFKDRLRTRATRLSHPLGPTFWSGVWPADPRPLVLDLDEVDRIWKQ